MVDKCRKCGAKQIKFPVYEGQEDDDKFSMEKFKQMKAEGKVYWLNFFKIDWLSVILILLIIFGVWAYNSDVEQYEQIATDPYGYCNDYCAALKSQAILGEDNSIPILDWEEINNADKSIP